MKGSKLSEDKLSAFIAFIWMSVPLKIASEQTGITLRHAYNLRNIIINRLIDDKFLLNSLGIARASELPAISHPIWQNIYQCLFKCASSWEVARRYPDIKESKNSGKNLQFFFRKNICKECKISEPIRRLPLEVISKLRHEIRQNKGSSEDKFKITYCKVCVFHSMDIRNPNIKHVIVSKRLRTNKDILWYYYTIFIQSILADPL